MPRMLLGKYRKRRRNMSPNAQLLRKGRAHNHQVRARTLCKQGQGAQSQSQQRRPFGRFGWWVQQDSNLPLIKSQLLRNLSYAPAVTPSRRALSEARQYAMGGASSATSELSCSNASDTAPLPRAFTGLTQRNRPITSCGVLRSRLHSKESLSRHTFRSTSLARQALLSMSTAPSGSPPAWL